MEHHLIELRGAVFSMRLHHDFHLLLYETMIETLIRFSALGRTPNPHKGFTLEFADTSMHQRHFLVFPPSSRHPSPATVIPRIPTQEQVGLFRNCNVIGTHQRWCFLRVRVGHHRHRWPLFRVCVCSKAVSSTCHPHWVTSS